MIRLLLASSFLSCALLAQTQPLDQNDVPYASPGGKQLLLDLHVPAGKGPFPAVIIVHGGGFDMGNKRTFVTPLFDLLTRAGFAWFTIDYRLAPDYRFPAPVLDLDAAIRWVKANAAKYRVDPKRIALIGESAGGYLVSYAGTHETPETRVAAVVAFYPPADMAALLLERTNHPEKFDAAKTRQHTERGGSTAFFGVDQPDAAGLARLREISPLSAVHKGMAPFLCIHGTADEQVPYEQSVSLCCAIQGVGTACELITVEGGRHGMGSWENNPAMQGWKPAMVTWLKRTLSAE
jgi:acetyl esterase